MLIFATTGRFTCSFKICAPMDYTFHYDSPLGGITMAGDGEALVGLWFDGQKHFAEVLHRQNTTADLPVFRETCRWLDIYFSGNDPGFIPKLCVRATPFRKEVCKILLAIPYGKTMTYSEIATQIAATRGTGKMSAQAVGGAVGHNPISIIIPCHRVVGAGGSLTGYAGGIAKKYQLLLMEKGGIPR